MSILAGSGGAVAARRVVANAVALHRVEPSGRSLDEDGEHAATLTKGSPGVMHGFKSYMLKDADGEPMEVYSVASGLDYPSFGPQHSYLKDIGRVRYAHINDQEAIDAFFELSRQEGSSRPSNRPMRWRTPSNWPERGSQAAS